MSVISIMLLMGLVGLVIYSLPIIAYVLGCLLYRESKEDIEKTLLDVALREQLRLNLKKKRVK